MAIQRINVGTHAGYMQHYRDEQVDAQQSWGQVPDNEMTMAAMSRISCVPENGSTTTYMNVLDPGTDDGWRDPPGGFGKQDRIPGRI